MAYPYDLVVLDVDGTLITSENKLAPITKSMIQEVRANNIGVTLASGRPRLTLAPFLTELAIDLPYVSSGGAHVIDPVHNKTLHYSMLPKDILAVVADEARSVKTPIVLQESDRIFYEGSLETLEYLSDTYKIDITVSDEFKAYFTHVDDIVEVHAEPTKVYMCNDPVIVQGIEERLRQRKLPIYMTYSAPPFLEITSSKANKGEALRQLATHLDIPLGRIIAIGDSRNDLSMFEIVGKRVAVANADPALKAIADVLAPSNDDDGVAWVLGELLAGRL